MTRGPNKGEGGRPKKAVEHHRSVSVVVRFTPAEMAAIEKHRGEKEPVSALVRRLALRVE